MKKMLVLSVCAVFCSSLIASCSDDNNPPKKDDSSQTVIPVIPINPNIPVNPGNNENNDTENNNNEDQPPVEEDPYVPPPADDSAVERFVDNVMVLPITYAPFTTLQIAHRPKIGCDQYTNEEIRKLIINRELRIDQTERYEYFGLGQEDVEGEPWNVRGSLLTALDPELSHKGKSLAWFWQISDPQITDEESPCRMEGVNIAPYITGSDYRAQAKYATHMFDVHLQTAMRISDLASRPFDFVLVTGDVSDNAQKNENEWFKQLMGGGLIHPDSGEDDDPNEGPNNDASDPYYTQGIGDIPWYIAVGNHDLLYMGLAVPTEEITAACTGGEIVDLFSSLSFLGTHEIRDGYRIGFQDASKPNSPIVTEGSTPADTDRRQLSKIEALQSFHDAPGKPVGHGLDQDTINTGWGYYSTYPLPDKKHGHKPLRLITLDTNGTSSEISMSKSQFDWLGEQIEDARSKNELVIVQSHHGTAQLHGNITQRDFQNLLASYPGVILHITGHGHENGSNVYKNLGKGYWEVMLASVVDFPSQTRLFEIVYEGEGIISIYITNLDANAPKGSFVDEALNFAAARGFFSFSEDYAKVWDDEKIHRNMILRTKVTREIYENIEQYDWSDTIESETLLKKLKYKPSNK